MGPRTSTQTACGFVLVVLLALLALPGAVQTGNSAPDSGSAPATPPNQASSKSFRLPLLKTFVQDQKAIWTAPLRLRAGDAVWLAPLAGVAGGMVATDAQFSRHLSSDP